MKTCMVVLALLVGCSDGASSTAAVDGTIDGTRFAASHAVSLATASAPGQAVVLITSADNVCVPSSERVAHPGEQSILIELLDDSGAAIAPGTYAIAAHDDEAHPAQYALMDTFVSDASCQNTVGARPGAVTGSVTITAVHDGAHAGRFDVTLDSGDRLTGTFDPDPCDLSDADREAPARCEP